MAKPLLRWAGSKQQLVGELASYWSDTKRRYVEPFAGSARLFFRLEPEEALLGDINTDLIMTYCEVRDNPKAVHSSLSSLPNNRDRYYELRASDPEMLTSSDRAARFIYLNRFCFNGLYRTNQSGKFNVPYGGQKSGQLPSLSALENTSDMLKRATIVCSDFTTTLKEAKEGDFVYLDPPFSVAGKRVFREYDSADFDDSDIARLRKCIEDLEQTGIEFVLSYDNSKEGVALAVGFNCRHVTTRRNIAGFSGSRRTATELLISNVKAQTMNEARMDGSDN